MPGDFGCERRVVELDVGRHASQHQASAAHIPAPHECGWIVQARPQNGSEYIDVLPGRDAAQQHDACLGRHCNGKLLQIAIERLSIPTVVLVNINGRKFSQHFGSDGLVGTLEPTGRRDHERLPEALRVRQLAAKVQATHEGKGFTERQRTFNQATRQRKL